ncbi:TauD/TfdA family dioxygenase [Erwinia piriflorinigrans]|nr:TauD/TfdA family dioxygenase [Erwinia piriflorinigrans]
MKNDRLAVWKIAQPVCNLAGYAEASSFIKYADSTIANEKLFHITFYPEALAAFKQGKLTQFLQAVIKYTGALLVRGWEIKAEDFQYVLDTLANGRRASYGETQSLRLHVGENVYTSTEHPSSQNIFYHNENSHRMIWPKLISFYCEYPSDSGGDTPIVNNYLVEGFLSEETKERFMRLGVRYRRNFRNQFGVPWQTVFETDDKKVVDDYCQVNDIQAEWQSNNDLTVTYDRPAYVVHPENNRSIWCNNVAFYHPLSLESRQYRTLRMIMKENEMPTYVSFGNGETIPPEIIEEIKNAYHQAASRFSWKAQDMLIMDNIIYAHGRDAFTGSRRILVTMAEPVTRSFKPRLDQPAILKACNG